MTNLLHRLLLAKSNSVFVQFFRYFFVGGVAFAADFGALAFLKEICGLHYIAANTISFIIGLTINYFISIFWVFTTSTFKNRTVEFLFFAVIGVIGLGINDVALWLLTEKCGIFYLLSKIVAAAVGYLWNFFARKYLLFQ